ncbi:MAG: histidine kinase [Crocinitomicaceae bacterium]|nr:histidine kinase [Crocinitomicaceae bacterium]
MFIVLPLFIVKKGAEISQDHKLQIVYLFVGLFSIGGYYLSYYLLLPKLFPRKKYIVFTILSVAFLLLGMSLTGRVIEWVGLSLPFNLKDYAYVLRIPILWIVAIGLYSFRRYKKLEMEKIKVELNALKAQIDPHFLFNVLNDIYAQALIKSESTPKSILKLSSIMRYVTTEANSEYVELEKEIHYLQNYVDLQKLRLTDMTVVKFEVKGELQQKVIPPLLFISFIENAFKYGVSNENETTIQIEFQVDGKMVSLQVKNDKPVKMNSQIESNHVGLRNTTNRLDLLYGDRYSLQINDKNDSFEINLKLPLND